MSHKFSQHSLTHFYATHDHTRNPCSRIFTLRTYLHATSHLALNLSHLLTISRAQFRRRSYAGDGGDFTLRTKRFAEEADQRRRLGQDRTLHPRPRRQRPIHGRHLRVSAVIVSSKKLMVAQQIAMTMAASMKWPSILIGSPVERGKLSRDQSYQNGNRGFKNKGTHCALPSETVLILWLTMPSVRVRLVYLIIPILSFSQQCRQSLSAMLVAKAAEEDASDKSGEKTTKGKKSIANHADDPIPFTQLLSKLDLGGGTENLFEITLSQVRRLYL